MEHVSCDAMIECEYIFYSGCVYSALFHLTWIYGKMFVALCVSLVSVFLCINIWFLLLTATPQIAAKWWQTKSWHLPIKMEIWFSHSQPKWNIYIFDLLVSLHLSFGMAFAILLLKRKRSHLIFHNFDFAARFSAHNIQKPIQRTVSHSSFFRQPIILIAFELTFGEKEIGGLPQENPLLNRSFVVSVLAFFLFFARSFHSLSPYQFNIIVLFCHFLGGL